MRLSAEDREQLQHIKVFIETHYGDQFSIDQLSQKALMSRSRLVKLYRLCYGMSPMEHLQLCRLAAGKRMLDEGRLAIKVIAVKCGYKYACNFSTAFKKMYGVSPRGFSQL